MINKGPSVLFEFKILKEVWSRNKVNVSYLKLFGSVAYVQTDNRNKLDLKVVKCFFIEYGSEKYKYHF